MANEFANSLKSVAERVASYVNKAAELSVETQYVEMDGNQTGSTTTHLAASTTIKMDGDCKSVIPVRRAANGNGLEVDAALYEIHQRNVATAIEYRTRMMDALLQALKDAIGR